MKKLLLLLSLITICTGIWAAQTEIDKEKRQEIEKMLRLTGMEKLMEQIKTQMISSLKTQMTEVPSTFWDKFQQKMDTRTLLEMIIPLYDKYYTTEDIKAVNAFYSSPTGQKLLATLPQIMQESVAIGQAWGEKIGKQAIEEMAQETINKKANP